MYVRGIDFASIYMICLKTLVFFIFHFIMKVSVVIFVLVIFIISMTPLRYCLALLTYFFLFESIHILTLSYLYRSTRRLSCPR